MGSQAATFVILAIYVAIMVSIGLYMSRRTKSSEDFMLGGRSVGSWLTAFSYGTTYFSAVVFIGYAGQFGWMYGASATWVGIGNAIIGSLIPFFLIGKRTRLMTNHNAGKCRWKTFGVGLPFQIAEHHIIQLRTYAIPMIQLHEKIAQIIYRGIILASRCHRLTIHHLALQYGIKPAEKQYPLPMRFGAIYSPGIVVFKASEDKNYEYLDKPFIVDILTIAALKNPTLTNDGMMMDDDKNIVRDKIRMMLNLALDWENDSVVFGAFGCGAYKNPPEEIAKLFKEVINEPNYKNKLKKITFAILDDGNSHRAHNPRGNFIPFKEEFEHE